MELDIPIPDDGGEGFGDGDPLSPVGPTGPPLKASKKDAEGGIRTSGSAEGTLHIDEDCLYFDASAHPGHQEVASFLKRLDHVRSKINSGHFKRSSSHDSLDVAREAIEQAAAAAIAHRDSLPQ